MNNETQNFARAEMLIRKPVAEVFAAFIDPAITTQFWFTHSTGRLDENRTVEWTWEMYGHTSPVTIKTIETDQRIVIEWGNYTEATTVEWTFKSTEGKGTFVSITNSGFKGSAEDILNQVRDATEGFTLVLAGLKALLEHGVILNLVGDRFPG